MQNNINKKCESYLEILRALEQCGDHKLKTTIHHILKTKMHSLEQSGGSKYMINNELLDELKDAMYLFELREIYNKPQNYQVTPNTFESSSNWIPSISTNYVPSSILSSSSNSTYSSISSSPLNTLPSLTSNSTYSSISSSPLNTLPSLTSNPTSNSTYSSIFSSPSNTLPRFTSNPTSNPTSHPTSNPTLNPTSNPTLNSTSNLTLNPTLNPTSDTKQIIIKFTDKQNKILNEWKSVPERQYTSSAYHYDWYMFPIKAKGQTSTAEEYRIKSDNDAIALINDNKWFNNYTTTLNEMISGYTQNPDDLLYTVRVYKMMQSMKEFVTLAKSNNLPQLTQLCNKSKELITMIDNTKQNIKHKIMDPTYNAYGGRNTIPDLYNELNALCT
jgi:hypothetical protein